MAEQVVLGIQQLQTLTFRQTLNPSYYEAMEMEVILPEMMQLAPDIVVGRTMVQTYMRNHYRHTSLRNVPPLESTDEPLAHVLRSACP